MGRGEWGAKQEQAMRRRIFPVAAIRDKANRVAVAYNKGPMTYVSDAETLKDGHRRDR